MLVWWLEYVSTTMECPVCYDVVATVDLNCTHKMCQGCATQWFQRSPTCPVCRAHVSHTALRLAAIPVPVHMENLSGAVSAVPLAEPSEEAVAVVMENLSGAVSVALQAMERSREAADAARALWQSELAAAPVLTLEMQADFDDEYAALDYDDYDYDDQLEIEASRERWRRGRQPQPAVHPDVVGW